MQLKAEISRRGIEEDDRRIAAAEAKTAAAAPQAALFQDFVEQVSLIPT